MNPFFWIGLVIGTAIMTFLISRLLLWVMRSWDGAVTKLVTVHVLSLVIAAFIGGMTMADADEFAGVRAAVIYAPAQMFWLLVDVIRHWRGSPREGIKTARKSY